MKIHCFAFLFISVGLLSLHARVWVDVKGRQLEAEYVSSDATSVTVQRISDSKEFTIPTETLSERDQAFVKEKSEANEPAILLPDARAFLEFQDYIQSFKIEGKRFSARYLGDCGLTEKPIESISTYADGLAFSPDGSRIAVSSGNGTTSHMRLFYWSEDGSEDEIIPLTYRKYEKGLSRDEREALEEDGILWFFGGQVAMNRSGEVFTTLGAAGGNGILKVQGSKLKRLNYCTSSSTLQIPNWDDRTVYLGRGDTIHKFRLSGNEAEMDGDFLNINGENLFISNALIIDTNRVILSLTHSAGAKDKDGRDLYKIFSILVDKEARGYYFLAPSNMGAMAISDQGRMVRCDGDLRKIVEFELSPIAQ